MQLNTPQIMAQGAFFVIPLNSKVKEKIVSLPNPFLEHICLQSLSSLFHIVYIVWGGNQIISFRDSLATNLSYVRQNLISSLCTKLNLTIRYSELKVYKHIRF